MTFARTLSLSAILIVAALGFGPARAETLVIDFTAIPSYSPDGPQNILMNYTIAPYAEITAVSWDATLTAYPKSALDEMFLQITGNLGGGIALEPGYGDSFAGTKSYSGSANLIDQGITFLANADGSLQLEFWDYSNDRPGADGIWNSGHVTIEYAAAAVPEPATGGLMMLGLLLTAGWQARRRGNAHR